MGPRNRLPKTAGPPARMRADTIPVPGNVQARQPEADAVQGEHRRRWSDRTPSLRLLRFAAVQERTGLSRTTIWRLEQCGAFPRHRRISANVVAWVEDEVTNWIRSKVDTLSA